MNVTKEMYSEFDDEWGCQGRIDRFGFVFPDGMTESLIDIDVAIHLGFRVDKILKKYGDREKFLEWQKEFSRLAVIVYNWMYANDGKKKNEEIECIDQYDIHTQSHDRRDAFDSRIQAVRAEAARRVFGDGSISKIELAKIRRRRTSQIFYEIGAASASRRDKKIDDTLASIGLDRESNHPIVKVVVDLFNDIPSLRPPDASNYNHISIMWRNDRGEYLSIGKRPPHEDWWFDSGDVPYVRKNMNEEVPEVDGKIEVPIWFVDCLYFMVEEVG